VLRQRKEAEGSDLAAPQGFEPRYADPEARKLRFCGIPAVRLISQEIPFFSIRFPVPKAPDDYD